MRPVGLRAILCRRLTQLPALKGLRAGSDKVSPAIGTKSCSKRLHGGSKGQTKKHSKDPIQTLNTRYLTGAGGVDDVAGLSSLFKRTLIFSRVLMSVYHSCRQD